MMHKVGDQGRTIDEEVNEECVYRTFYICGGLSSLVSQRSGDSLASFPARPLLVLSCLELLLARTPDPMGFIT